jgi:hypothetical protein
MDEREQDDRQAEQDRYRANESANNEPDHPDDLDPDDS